MTAAELARLDELVRLPETVLLAIARFASKSQVSSTSDNSFSAVSEQNVATNVAHFSAFFDLYTMVLVTIPEVSCFSHISKNAAK